ncbi:MAG: histidine phosphatase family protein [Alphaproteobacteria bacterium CG_4_10_14_0_2_um_filter_63_37]|nr:MAG: hypothetical protein AUJ55_03635 [Proteobacteria bacterium CG1_02_64_396]PJA25540.1 MAG: histidine phosphatase family protein [Alphaproteobacteria bacterium CG_4_10_14_0_2_um_filter_63_37]
MTDLLTIDLLRHGAVAGPERVFRGRVDPPLSDEGRRQMDWVAHALQAAELTALAASPLIRCADFATDLAARRNLPLHLDGAFAEIDFGAWDGLTFEQIQTFDPEGLARFQADPTAYTPARGEPLLDFGNRVVAGWQDWLACDQGDHRLLIAHGGVLRVVLAHVLGLPLSQVNTLMIPYAGWSRVALHPESGRGYLLFHNREPAPCVD